MASRSFYDEYGFDTGEAALGGTFAPQGTSEPTIVSKNVGAFKVVRNSAGNFTVSLLDDQGNPLTVGNVKSLRASLQQVSATNLVVNVLPYVASSSSFGLIVTNPTTGVATDISANASNAIFFHLDTCALPPLYM